MRRHARRPLCLVVWVIARLPVASAATITVDSTADDLDLGPNGNCTLREAIAAANTDAAVDLCAAGSGADTIEIPAGTYRLTIAGAKEDANATGDLDVTSDVTLAGAGASETVIDGGFGTGGDPVDRVLHVRGGETVAVRDLTIQHGKVPTESDAVADRVDSGGGIRIEDGDVTLERVEVLGNQCADYGSYVGWMVGMGGGIALQSGTLHVSDSTIAGNLCNRGGGLRVEAGEARLVRTVVSDNAAIFEGGGLSAASGTSLTLEASAVVRNDAIREWCFGFACAWAYSQGGGIANHGETSIQNSTIADNIAQPAPERAAVGAAIFNDGTLRIADSTLAGQTGTSSDTIVSETQADGVAVLRSSIVAPGCVGGGVVSEGFNVESSTTCAFDAPSDLAGVDPGLAALAIDPAGTWVMPLESWSPAIDSGDDATCPATDQRGGARPVDGNGDGVARCDRGAYETAYQPNGGCSMGPGPSLASAADGVGLGGTVGASGLPGGVLELAAMGLALGASRRRRPRHSRAASSVA